MLTCSYIRIRKIKQRTLDRALTLAGPGQARYTRNSPARECAAGTADRLGLTEPPASWQGDLMRDQERDWPAESGVRASEGVVPLATPEAAWVAPAPGRVVRPGGRCYTVPLDTAESRPYSDRLSVHLSVNTNIGSGRHFNGD
jgi:hypothetical protein